MSNLKKLIIILVLFVLLVGGYAVYMFCFYEAPIDLDNYRAMLGETTTEAPAESAVGTAASDPTSNNSLLLMNVTTLSNEKSGTQRAFIRANKSQFKDATPKMFCEFYDKAVAPNNGKLSRLTVVFEDGTGIEFRNCDINAIYYGKLDDDGMVATDQKTIKLCKDNSVIYDGQLIENEKPKSKDNGISLNEYKNISGSSDEDNNNNLPAIRTK